MRPHLRSLPINFPFAPGSLISSRLLLPRVRTDTEPPVIARDRSSHPIHRRLEVLMTRVDVEPLLQDVVRCQLRKFFDDARMMRMLGADQDAVPFPPPSSGWFDQDHHHPAEQVDGEPTEHPLGEETRVVFEDLKDPFVVERLHRDFI